MKYELETIPVWDAYKQDSECPLCLLEKKNEDQYLQFFLGDSVMDPDTRVEANRRGFCPYHSELLFNGGHKLGVALMTHSYLIAFLDAFRAVKKNADDSAAKTKKPVSKLIDVLTRPLSDCVFCRRLSDSIDRYVFTILWLYRKDPDFRETLVQSKGFCLNHLARVIAMADTELKGSVRDDLIDSLLSIEEKRLEVLENEIEWFTLKFDYRNKDKPWGNSKDSLSRTLQKLKGYRFLRKQDT